ncbi:META domain-containing protein [Segniliparus rugosus]|uniref:DUF306 domain-containing protein n=1 Tax=Segniliparus rugosus (strain ATCC BAA-974 / DSM 45345 / CCUG 50838 / CIP 108380 / JCM 13579 / CDC 945) TaxID=679197 RepID=E5XPC9_SEGRC|nr:META domain-containing protein [Segniliparus rugosus]EFV13789.2 hypothetical protein HMPREF9336_01351 [Segniliparus rugosus ATCC BAA-974]
MRRVLLGFSLIAPALLGGVAAGPAAASPNDPPDALYGAWAVASAAGPGSQAAMAAPSLRVRFGPDKVGLRVGVSGGCNGIGGAGSFDGDQAAFRPLISTMMACEPPLMEADSFVSKVLEGPVRFELRGDTLLLRNGARTLELARDPEDGEDG